MSTPPRRPPASSKTASAPASRRRREVLIALLALPVLLVLGLFVGNALTDDDTVDVAGSTPASAPAQVTPEVQGPAAASTTTPAPTTPATTTSAPTTPAPAAAPDATSSSEAATGDGPSAAAPTTSPPTSSATSSSPPSTPAPAPSASSDPPDEGADGEGDGDQAGVAPAQRSGGDVVYARGSVGPDVRVWQARMAERGWLLRADGIFGPRTESVLRSFQAEKGLTVDGLLGDRTWTAAWSEAIT